MTKSNEKLASFLSAAASVFGQNTDYIFTGAEIQKIRKETGISIPNAIYSSPVSHDTPRVLGAPARKCRMFNIASAANVVPMATPAPSAPAPVAAEVKATVEVASTIVDNLVPAKNPLYVKFGNFSYLVKILKSGKFFPTLITGLSGNGKTMAVEQACANTKREFIRVNITSETDQDDLIGGFRLKNGETVWHDGPVIEAMKRGGVLLLDEFDLGTDKIMCLQSILEGKPYFIKKTGRLVEAAPGFQIFLTANTKGQGDNTGRFIGARVMNEALLDRIKLTLEQGYPTATQEKKILNLIANSATPDTVTDEDSVFVEKVVGWVQAIRQSFFNEEIDSFISTRRAGSLIESYYVFGRDKEFAVKSAISRFDSDTVEAFETFYSAIDENYGAEEQADETTTSSPSVDVPDFNSPQF